MVYFIAEESPYTNKYIIRPNFPNLPLTSTNGSYNILMARIMNLSYAAYLRMCRDLYGAEIIGKGHKYCVAYFNEYSDVKPLLEELNKRTKILMRERENNESKSC